MPLGGWSRIPRFLGISLIVQSQGGAMHVRNEAGAGYSGSYFAQWRGKPMHGHRENESIQFGDTHGRG